MRRLACSVLMLMVMSLMIAGTAMAGTYYISTSGSDSNSGTTESSPWAHLPGMATWAGSYTPSAGDTFTLRGCDDWPNANFPVNWKWSGTSTAHITIGADQTWYNTANCPNGWNRPKFDAGSAVINPPECTGTNAFWVFSSVSYVDVNWIELINYYWASANSEGSCASHDFMVSVSTSASSVTWNNSYAHAWTHGAGSGDLNGNAFNNGCSTCSVNYLVMDNSDGSEYSGGGMQWPTLHSIFAYVANAIKPHMSGEYAYNNISHLGTGPGGNHPNCIETIGPIGGSGIFYIHDNVIHDMLNSPTEQCETLQVGNTGETDYVWNNVFYNLGGGDIARLPQNNLPNVTALYMFNNVWEEDQGSVCGAMNTSGNNWVTAFVMVNNFCITSSGPSGTTQSQKMLTGTVTGAATILFSNNVVESIATANAHGCSVSETYVYAPTTSCQDTVGQGSNLSSTYWPAGYSANDTSYACTQQTVTSGTVYQVVESVCPGRQPVQRPAAGAGAWDAGAYEFGQPSGPPGTPPSLSDLVR